MAEAIVAPEPMRAAYGELRFGAGIVVPHFTLDDGDTCGDGGTEFCKHALLVSGYGGAYIPVSSDWSLITDLALDYHGSTDDSSDSGEALRYAAVGLHAVYEAGARPWGVFVMFGHNSAHEVPEEAPDFAGVGFEMMLEDFWVQVGGVHTWEDGNDVDGIDSLYFVRGGRDFDVGQGTLRLSAALGFGDSDADDGGGINDDDGHWAQLSARYFSPLNDNMEWFVGYQGDLVSIDETTEPLERSFVSGFEIGLRMAFGADGSTSNRLPFETPNLRAPLSYAGDF
ncbi:MAG: hypothetical protein AAF762_15315, partial [Pseudomonadota bacterium]